MNLTKSFFFPPNGNAQSPLLEENINLVLPDSGWIKPQESNNLLVKSASLGRLMALIYSLIHACVHSFNIY